MLAQAYQHRQASIVILCIRAGSQVPCLASQSALLLPRMPICPRHQRIAIYQVAAIRIKVQAVSQLEEVRLPYRARIANILSRQIQIYLAGRSSAFLSPLKALRTSALYTSAQAKRLYLQASLALSRQIQYPKPILATSQDLLEKIIILQGRIYISQRRNQAAARSFSTPSIRLGRGGASSSRGSLSSTNSESAIRR